MKKEKICLAASAGGHLNQLLALSPVWQEYDFFFVTSLENAAGNLRKQARTYVLGECNRQHPLRTCMVAFRALKAVCKERPSIVLSTGAAPGFLICFWAKLFGAEIIWLDSIANINKLSLSGRLVRPFADLILSQWPEVAAAYKRVEYAGEVV